MIIETASKNDIDQILDWDKKFYPEEWRVAKEQVEKVFQRNSEFCRVLRTDGRIKGYYAILPLPENAYESILIGQLKEKDLHHYILDYDGMVNEVYLYFVSMIVDIHDPLRKCYSKAMVQDIAHYLTSLTNKGVTVREIGLIAVSDHGKRFAKRIGFSHQGETLKVNGISYPVFRARLNEVLQAISC